MPSLLQPDDHLAGIRDAVAAMAAYAGRAGLDAPVPTCPDWSVLDLLAHQGMVHRWAAAILRGEGAVDDVPEASWEDEGRRTEDPAGWLRAGAAVLLDVLAEVADDADVPVFLPHQGSPRAFWARRQCHETTIHAVDALAAAVGRPPIAAETWITGPVALDGIDELLEGFVARPRSRLRCEDEQLLVVDPADAPDWWEVRLSPRPAVVTRHAGRRATDEPDYVVDGPAVEVYLRLWNRQPPEAHTDRWRRLAAVRWT